MSSESLCQCCEHRPTQDKCYQCGKHLCYPCSYLFQEQSFCRLTFKDCYQSSLGSEQVADPEEYRGVIPCAHTDKQHEAEEQRRKRNQVRREAKKSRKVLDAQGQRDLSFFIPDEQLILQEDGWQTWSRQEEFNEFMRTFRPDLITDCRPFNYFYHTKKGQLSHSYHIYFERTEQQLESTKTTSEKSWKNYVNRFCRQELYPALRETFQVTIRE